MKRKKIFYVPGIISLLGLATFALLYSPKPPQRLHAMSLFLPHEGHYDTLSRFSAQGFLRKIKGKTHVEIDLNEVYPTWQSLLFQRRQAFITREIERIQFTHDTNTVLRIHLGANNTYGHFIWLLDQATLSGLKHYVLIDDNFYFMANPPIDTTTVPIQPLYL